MNSLLMIAPYWQEHLQTWVFDDALTGLVQEPFVCGIPEMINHLVQDIPNNRSGFRLIFSATPFPGHQRHLTWLREEWGGNWYQADEPPMEGWLCPALFKYFDDAPRDIYLKAEALG